MKFAIIFMLILVYFMSCKENKDASEYLYKQVGSYNEYFLKEYGDSIIVSLQKGGYVKYYCIENKCTYTITAPKDTVQVHDTVQAEMTQEIINLNGCLDTINIDDGDTLKFIKLMRHLANGDSYHVTIKNK